MISKEFKETEADGNNSKKVNEDEEVKTSKKNTLQSINGDENDEYDSILISGNVESPNFENIGE